MKHVVTTCKTLNTLIYLIVAEVKYIMKEMIKCIPHRISRYIYIYIAQSGNAIGWTKFTKERIPKLFDKYVNIYYQSINQFLSESLGLPSQ